ncbi:MAG: hypothetical protein ACXWWC_13530 [Chitinophagaceae bacterium]
MAKSKTKATKTISLKKEINQQLTNQLTTTLPGLKEILGEKKFESRIKKAAKLLSNGIKEKATRKIKEVKKKINKKEIETAETVMEI